MAPSNADEGELSRRKHQSSPRFSTDAAVAVRVILSPSRACKDYLDRNLVLTMDRSDVQIGRMSHRNPGLHASSTNAWFDSPVMSRQHAMLHFDSDETVRFLFLSIPLSSPADMCRQKLYIQDTGSLHGTFQNGIRLSPTTLHQLNPYDELCFGTTVDRNTDIYPPCTMVVTFEFVCTDREQANPVVYRISDDSDVEEIACLTRPQTKPVVYRVPDYSDVEEISDDDEEEEDDDDDEEEDSSIRGSIIALRRNGKVKPVHKIPDELLSALSMTEHRLAEAPASDDEDELPLSAMPPKDHTGEKERCESEWQPSSPTVYSADDEKRDAAHHVKLYPAECEEDDTTSSEWEDCSSSGRAPVASPRFPSALPASWETEGLPSSTNSSRSVFGTHQGTERPNERDSMSPVLQGAAVLPSISASPPPNGKEVKKSRDFDERESSKMKGSANFCDPANTLVSGECRGVIASRVPKPVPAMAIFSPPPPPRPASLSRGRSAESAAQALGEKTGKMAYFAARLGNRRFLESAAKDLSVAGLAAGEGHCEVESVTDKDEGGSGGDGSGHCSLFGLSIGSAHPLEGPPTTSLLASGEKFLSSPLLEPEAPVRPPRESPDLNETSAYQFLLSKANAAISKHEAAKDEAAAQQKAVTKEHDVAVVKQAEAAAKHGSAVNKEAHDQGTTSLVIVDGEQAANTQKGSWRKRKAGEMSADLGDGEAATLAPTPSASTTTGTGKDECRTVKRLRLAAEVLGYAALGGVAVVSALIATAPSL
ncbi:hypothetical protein L249_0953 [Ophiocordyceps polyrhachis-furcata BCC 54312]|uniref:FHA domain-containing protein n=1 Tax=Ophiocordyceps polyrhachis-furcata BCC 54312 TaxID=1330021 RepID=A0A367LEC0_9HYPO|nr:hypothetical protein L249_0953 [Ophiocordyceps polyrhachis-furcata BCC 54312]